MKAVLLLVACLAFASAARPAFEVETIASCANSYTLLCAAGNGSSCATTVSGTSYTVRYCPSGTYPYGGQGVSTCWCKNYDYTTVTLGATCTAGQTSQDGSVCTVKGGTSTDTQTYWFSVKKQGDTCSSTFDCYPPNTCSNGKCYGQLLTGETCYNATASPVVSLTAACGIKDYCSISSGIGLCTARLALGDDCTATGLAAACPGLAQGYSSCLTSLTDSSKKTCQVARQYWIPAGQALNTSATDCYDGVSNGTWCITYAAAYAAYQPFNGASCSLDSDCSAYGSCDCTNAQGVSDAAKCYWTRDGHDALAAAYATRISKLKQYYDAGCGWVYNDGVMPPANSNAYCKVSLGDYSATYSVCGAMHNMALSSVTMVLSAIVAVFLAKW